MARTIGAAGASVKPRGGLIDERGVARGLRGVEPAGELERVRSAVPVSGLGQVVG
jgi:hypothetical protein